MLLGLIGGMAFIAGASVAAQTHTSDIRSFHRVQYLGGAVGVRGKSLNWGHTLEVTADRISLKKKGEILVDIQPEQVVALYYAGRRFMKDASVGEAAVKGAIMAGGVGAGIGALYTHLAKKKTQHLIAIEFLLPDGTPSGVLLRAHKSNHEQMFRALRDVTDATVEN